MICPVCHELVHEPDTWCPEAKMPSSLNVEEISESYLTGEVIVEPVYSYTNTNNGRTTSFVKIAVPESLIGKKVKYIIIPE